MINPILQVSDPIVRERCIDLPEGWEAAPEVKALFTDLRDTCSHHHALGLAANQIGVLFRVITLSPRSDCPWQILVNPVITNRAGAQITSEEGCMSIDMGRKKFRVKRDQKITVRFNNQKGDEIEWTTTGLAARVIQHEVDHLDGILIDRPPLAVAEGWNAPALHSTAS